MPTPYAVCPLSLLEEVARLGAKYQHPPRRKATESVNPEDKRNAEERGIPVGSDQGWEMKYVHKITGEQVKVTINARGRLLLTVGGREIILLRTDRAPSTRIGRGTTNLIRGSVGDGRSLASTSTTVTNDPTPPEQKLSGEWSVFAFDRHCYHVGYPLDLGDVEEYPKPAAALSGFSRIPPNTDDQEKKDYGVYQCINCPLHNRIFDLETGDMLALDEKSTACSTGCFQRVHEWTVVPLNKILGADGPTKNEEDGQEEETDFFCFDSKHHPQQEQQSSKGSAASSSLVSCRLGAVHGLTPKLQRVADPERWDPIDPWVVVLDSHGESNPLVMTKKAKVQNKEPTAGSQDAPVAEEEVVVYIPNQRVPSDTYNRRDGVQLEWKKEVEEPNRKKARTE